MAFADPTRVLVGIHPTLIQVPPSLPPSIRATFAPIAAARFAAPSPPIPPPTTARLYVAIASASWPYLTGCRECGFRLHVSYEELAPFTFVEESVQAWTDASPGPGRLRQPCVDVSRIAMLPRRHSNSAYYSWVAICSIIEVFSTPGAALNVVLGSSERGRIATASARTRSAHGLARSRPRRL